MTEEYKKELREKMQNFTKQKEEEYSRKLDEFSKKEQQQQLQFELRLTEERKSRPYSRMRARARTVSRATLKATDGEASVASTSRNLVTKYTSHRHGHSYGWPADHSRFLPTRR